MLFGKAINKYYAKYRYLFFIGILCLLAVDFFQLYVPDYLGTIVDFFDGGNIAEHLNEIYVLIVKIVIVALIMCVGRIAFRLTIFRGSTNMEAALKRDMFKKAERLSQTYYHSNRIGDVLSYVTSDVEEIESFLRWGTVTLIDAIFLTAFALARMIMLDWFLTLVSSLPLILIAVWGALVRKFMSKNWAARQKANDDLYSFSQETFTGIRVIKAFVKENQQIKHFAKVARKNKDTNIKFVKTSVIFDMVINIIIALVTTLILGVGAVLVYHTVTKNPLIVFGLEVTLSAGKLITYYGYFNMLIWPMMAVGQIFTMHSRARTSLNRIQNFLNQEEDIKDEENSVELVTCKGAIEFKNFSFKYPNNDDYVLKNISLKINDGEMIGVVGKIGSGKSTLVNSILRLYNVENNSILIDDVDLMNIKVKSLREQISFVSQDNFLFSTSIKNNITFGKNGDENDVYEAARFSDVYNDINEFEDKFDTVTGERGVTLSGGQKQRVSIARAYFKNSPIMVLDDSVSAVDTKTEDTILKNIRELRGGKTTIIVASRVSTVSHLDKIAVLKDGELEAFDTPQNLLKISPTYQKMVELQKLEEELTE